MILSILTSIIFYINTSQVHYNSLQSNLLQVYSLTSNINASPKSINQISNYFNTFFYNFQSTPKISLTIAGMGITSNIKQYDLSIKYSNLTTQKINIVVLYSNNTIISYLRIVVVATLISNTIVDILPYQLSKCNKMNSKCVEQIRKQINMSGIERSGIEPPPKIINWITGFYYGVLDNNISRFNIFSEMTAINIAKFSLQTYHYFYNLTINYIIIYNKNYPAYIIPNLELNNKNNLIDQLNVFDSSLINTISYGLIGLNYQSLNIKYDFIINTINQHQFTFLYNLAQNISPSLNNINNSLILLYKFYCQNQSYLLAQNNTGCFSNCQIYQYPVLSRYCFNNTCDTSCFNCLNNNSCIICINSDLYLFFDFSVNLFKCVQNCLITQYINLINQINYCQNYICQKSCYTCSGITNKQCLSCNQDRFLYNNICVCLSGTINVNGTCIKCINNCSNMVQYSLQYKGRNLNTIYLDLKFSNNITLLKKLSQILTVYLNGQPISYNQKQLRLLMITQNTKTFSIQFLISQDASQFNISTKLNGNLIIFNNQNALTQNYSSLELPLIYYSNYQLQIVSRISASLDMIGNSISYIMIASPVIALKFNVFDLIKTSSQLFLMLFINIDFSNLFTTTTMNMFSLKATDFITPLGYDMNQQLSIQSKKGKSSKISQFLGNARLLYNISNCLTSFLMQLLGLQLLFLMGKWIPFQKISNKLKNLMKKRTRYYYLFLQSQVTFTVFCICTHLREIKQKKLQNLQVLQNILAYILLFIFLIIPAVYISLCNDEKNMRKILQIIPQSVNYSQIQLKFLFYFHYLQLILIPFAIGYSTIYQYQIFPIILYILIKVVIFNSNIKFSDLISYFLLFMLWILFPIKQNFPLILTYDYFGMFGIGLIIGLCFIHLSILGKDSLVMIIKLFRKQEGCKQQKDKNKKCINNKQKQRELIKTQQILLEQIKEKQENISKRKNNKVAPE